MRLIEKVLSFSSFTDNGIEKLAWMRFLYSKWGKAMYIRFVSLMSNFAGKFNCIGGR